MSIAKQIISAAAAASIATGVNAGDKPLPPFIKPTPEEAVFTDQPFYQALKNLATTVAAKQTPSDRMSQEVISAAYNRIRKEQGKPPRKDQVIPLFEYAGHSAVVVDPAQKTIVLFKGTEDAMSGKITITDKKPLFIYSQDHAIKHDLIIDQAVAAIEKGNKVMEARTKAMPNLGNALQPGDKTGKLAPIDQKQR